MIPVQGMAAMEAGSPLVPYSFERRDPGPQDVLIDILYCGICHSDIHQARNEWGGSIYPMVPGHEIVGTVRQVGKDVKRFKPGDTVGVGCLVDSCRTCPSCRAHEEQFCPTPVWTYNSLERDGKTPTQGGYSTAIVADEAFVLKIPKGQPLERVAPLLCAGITTYSPLRHWKVGAGTRVAVLGLGGLGHMAVKIAASLGAEVAVLSSSPAKASDAKRLGAHRFEVLPKDAVPSASLHGKFDFILDTVSAPHDLNGLLGCLTVNGSLVVVGVPTAPSPVHHFSLIMGRRSLAGSLIGGIQQTQEMLDYCASKNILADVEVISLRDVNTAYERMIRGDVRYRFVIDLRQ